MERAYKYYLCIIGLIMDMRRKYHVLNPLCYVDINDKLTLYYNVDETMCKDNFGEIMYIHLFLLYDNLSQYWHEQNPTQTFYKTQNAGRKHYTLEMKPDV